MKYLIIKLSRSLFLFLFGFLFLGLSPIFSQKYYYPDKTSWEHRDPAKEGMDDSKLTAAVNFAQGNEYTGSHDLRVAILSSFGREPYMEIVGPTKKRGGPSGLIIRHGYILAQWGDPDRVDMTFSVTKSYLSTVAGLAYDDGLIKLQDKVAKYVWDGTFDGEHNEKITWHQLLNQSSDWSGSLFGMPDWGDRPSRDDQLDDWKYRELKEPGTSFKYNDVRVNLLAYSLLQVYRRPLPVILKERIMDPIGASTTWRWFGYKTSWVTVDGMKIQSVSGGGHSGGGLFINTFDHARLGLLFLREGNWNGKQLISKDWVNDVQKSSEANERYGYMWWLNRGPNKWEGVSDKVYYAAGFGGNYIVIDKENDLVMVVRWLEPSKIGEFVKLVTESVRD